MRRLRSLPLWLCAGATGLVLGACGGESRARTDSLPPSTALPGAAPAADAATKQASQDTALRDTLQDTMRDTLRDSLRDSLRDTVPR